MTSSLKHGAQAADPHLEVRVTRGYLAGFGTSGALLVGAALIFVLASAIVAFHGWPQVTSTPPAVNVSVSEVQATPGSRASRALAAVLTVHGGASAAAGAPGAATRAGAVAANPSAGAAPNGSRRPLSNGPTPTVATQGCSAGCTSPGVPPGPSGLTGAVGQAISQVGAGAGSAISGTTSSLANQSKGVSPSGAGVIKSTGEAIGGTVTSATHTVGKLVKHLGH